MVEARTVRLDSSSAVDDLGLIGLRDLAGMQAGTGYRVVGGHMIRLLHGLYPTRTPARGTADIDAAIPRGLEAVGESLHEGLTTGGYLPVQGNRYERAHGRGTIVIELLTASTTGRIASTSIAGRQVDAVPGLELALATDPILIRVDGRLRTGEEIEFEVPVPSVECALVLKAHAWRSRLSPKDVEDINTLLEIADDHRPALEPWGLTNPALADYSPYRRARAHLTELAQRLRRGGMTGLPSHLHPPRMAALIARHVSKPGRL
ncbi:hypothetical protein BKD30_14075 [Tersicoccus phoenicis]|uniref:Uncharacterized protein n=1 Tax=Tersicoccus phoenicis TaxID=554083 RepID=A0A1R1L6J5_9MICC|nr:hypothetical protein [Tersicoccus phoenicis]OMH23158.1 hypothetical protein BKD30_14075 [Tersicoccus phoenicis]